jgi:hypothetical protein
MYKLQGDVINETMTARHTLFPFVTLLALYNPSFVWQSIDFIIPGEVQPVYT